MRKFTKKEIIIAIIILVLLLILILFLIFKPKSSNTSNSTVDDTDSLIYEDTEIEEDTNSGIDFKKDTNSATLWTGAMVEEKFSSSRKAHITYTFTFSYETKDQERTITDVNVTDISAKTNLPNGDLKILPFAHASYSANGGSVPSTLMYEDWNTYGYVYVTDYSNMQSLGSTYSPNICTKDMICDYLDEVGTKGGRISLRFKYVGVGNSMSESPSFQTSEVIKAAGITPEELSGTFSWNLSITMDDGTIETKEYIVEVDANSLDLSSSNTSTIEF
jgi:uncharacterized protein YxeA